MPQRIFTIDFEGEGRILGHEQYDVPIIEGALEKNLEKMFSILENTKTSPSFFMLASTAEKYPLIVKGCADKSWILPCLKDIIFSADSLSQIAKKYNKTLYFLIKK